MPRLEVGVALHLLRDVFEPIARALGEIGSEFALHPLVNGEGLVSPAEGAGVSCLDGSGVFHNIDTLPHPVPKVKIYFHYFMTDYARNCIPMLRC